MQIEIKLKNNRTYECSSSIIGKTYENCATSLVFHLDESMIDKKFYIEFEKPNGMKFTTDELEINNSSVVYQIPNSLLDQKGDLKVEVILRTLKEEVWKSYTIKFNILNSINATESIPEQYPDFVSKAEKVINLIKTDGDGKMYLSNDGTYKQVQSGSSDYNELTNKPINYLTGTEDKPIYLKDLETGCYILNGLFTPYEGSDISSTGFDNFIQVYRNETDVHILLNDISINSVEYYQVSIDGSNYNRSVITFDNIQYKERININSRTTTYTTLLDNSSYQCSVTQTRIILKFPSNIEAGFKCSYVFKTDDTIPTFNCEYDIKWHGDSIENNTFTIKANKSYRIDFWKDINNMNAEVREV